MKTALIICSQMEKDVSQLERIEALVLGSGEGGKYLA
jgi:hypothetical protein